MKKINLLFITAVCLVCLSPILPFAPHYAFIGLKWVGKELIAASNREDDGNYRIIAARQAEADRQLAERDAFPSR